MALLALAVLAALTLPGSLSASCGRHVHSARESQFRQPCTPGVDCPISNPMPVPCTGPTCKERHDSIPPAPATPPVWVVQWGLLPILPSLPPSNPRYTGDDAGNSRAIHRAFPPDPPPRVLAAV